MFKKTLKGATSMIVIIFFTLLAGILMVSFVSVMLANITESTNYNLSQSAYDSALAGIEDAKVMLLEYNACAARGDMSSSYCSTVVANINAADSEKDCDLVRKTLNRATNDEQNETLIRTDNSSINGSADSLDMAYTCVLVSLNTADYLGSIRSDSDMKVIPLRTHLSSTTNADTGSAEDSQANTVKIQWFSSSDYERERNTYGDSVYNNFSRISGLSKRFTNNKKKIDSNNYNKFAQKSTMPPVISVGLIQTANVFTIDSFYASSGTNTNRGRLTLRPSTSGKTRINNTDTEGFAVSAMSGKVLKTDSATSNFSAHDKNYANSPIDVKCSEADSITDSTYACTAYIRLPNAISDVIGNGKIDHSRLYADSTPNDLTRFLTLSMPYSSPETSFSVSMLDCTNEWWNSDGVNGECKTVDFVGVQSSVDSTGRANDVFRRVDARVELVDTGFPYPKYSLGLYGDDSVIRKDYEVTYRCWDIKNGSVSTDGNSSGYCNDIRSVSNPGFID